MTHSCAEKGIVTSETSDGRIEVRVSRSEACGSCEAKGACSALGGSTADIILLVENSLDAEIGDEVLLEMAEGAVMKASAAVYLVPAVNLILGGLVGAGLSKLLHADRDAATLLGAALGLLVGLVLSGAIGGKMSKNPTYVPTLLEVIRRESTLH